MAGSDVSRSCIVGYGSSPSRRGPDGRRGLWSNARSPRFRRDPFLRDVAFDPGRATAPRMTVPHMLPSTLLTVSASASFWISWLNPTPHRIAVRFAGTVTGADATLATRRALPLTWAGLAPAGSRQLPGAQAIHAYALSLDCLLARKKTVSLISVMQLLLRRVRGGPDSRAGRACATRRLVLLSTERRSK